MQVPKHAGRGGVDHCIAGLSSAVGMSSAPPHHRYRMPTPGGLSQTAVRHRRIHATLVLHIRQLKHICKLLCDWEFITVAVSIIRAALCPLGASCTRRAVRTQLATVGLRGPCILSQHARRHHHLRSYGLRALSDSVPSVAFDPDCPSSIARGHFIAIVTAL